MTEAEATALLTNAISLVAAAAGLLPTLASNIAAIKGGFAEADLDKLNSEIIAAHEQVQDYAGKLAALVTPAPAG